MATGSIKLSRCMGGWLFIDPYNCCLKTGFILLNLFFCQKFYFWLFCLVLWSGLSSSVSGGCSVFCFHAWFTLIPLFVYVFNIIIEAQKVGIGYCLDMTDLHQQPFWMKQSAEGQSSHFFVVDSVSCSLWFLGKSPFLSSPFLGNWSVIEQRSFKIISLNPGLEVETQNSKVVSYHAWVHQMWANSPAKENDTHKAMSLRSFVQLSKWQWTLGNAWTHEHPVLHYCRNYQHHSWMTSFQLGIKSTSLLGCPRGQSSFRVDSREIRYYFLLSWVAKWTIWVEMDGYIY
jgi:hypothetical protein